MNADSLLMTASNAAQTTNVNFILHTEIMSHAWMKANLMKLLEHQRISEDPGNSYVANL